MHSYCDPIMIIIFLLSSGLPGDNGHFLFTLSDNILNYRKITIGK